ncbi:MAG: COX15/CtaA family protein [candidate division Zixibacteria bacterium]|nr:COX15/CtaA family protein [candidate division Zixibacteria bacterium]
MSSFRKLALTATASTYFLVFVGGLVRVSGAGMGCPDWPKCFGRWIPPLSLSQIPPDIDPTSFNMTLAWIEYVNRLVGMSVGIIIAALAIMALVKYRSYPKLLYPSIGAALLVAYQGWQGSQVVASDLQPIVVTLHLLIALLIVSLLMFVSQHAYCIDKGLQLSNDPQSKRMRMWIGLLWLGAIAQIVLGTQVRAEVEIAAAEFPLLSSLAWLSKVGATYGLHLVTGIILIVGTIAVSFGLLFQGEKQSTPLGIAAFSLSGIAFLQMFLGLGLITFGLSPITQLFHLWLASLLIGLILVAFTLVSYREESTNAPGRISMRIFVAIASLILLLAVGSYAIVAQAERSRAALPIITTAPQFHFDSARVGEIDNSVFDGKVTVVDFVFTHCKGACPAMAIEMASLYNRYAHSDKVQFLSFTVDPENDTPDVLQAYAEGLGVNDMRWLFLRHESPDTIKQLCESGYLVSGDLPGMHSTKFILVDPDGRIRGYYEHSDRAKMDILRTHIEALAKEIDD